MDERGLPEVQRFRPYCVPGGQVAQVRLNPQGMYVRWNDYQRLHVALSELLVKCLAYAPAAANPAISQAREALDTHTDWDHVFRGTSNFQGCVCYAYEGDSENCTLHHSGGDTSGS